MPAPHVNVIVGENNAGKTTMLEGIYYCSSLKSFRSCSTDNLIMLSEKKLQLSLKSTKINENNLISIEKKLNSVNSAKINDKKATVKDIMLATPVIALTFGTENAVTQSADYRRGLLDWGAFHVEPSYLSLYKQYMKMLKQRNNLLKSTPTDSLQFWTEKLAATGSQLDDKRRQYFTLLSEQYSNYINLIESYSDDVYDDIKNTLISYYKGWDSELGLAEALSNSFTKDSAIKYTSVGPHRGDILLTKDNREIKSISSMSTQIILSLLIVLSQSEVFHVKHGFRPIILIDDILFGIDDKNLKLVINLLLDSKAQSFVSAPDLYKDKIRSLDKDSKEVRLYEIHNGVIKEESE
tara:strand:- start:6795 stop:7850 length:1056 start_codon:yes stop_codon:yes gene_type:complete